MNISSPPVVNLLVVMDRGVLGNNSMHAIPCNLSCPMPPSPRFSDSRSCLCTHSLLRHGRETARIAKQDSEQLQPSMAQDAPSGTFCSPRPYPLPQESLQHLNPPHFRRCQGISRSAPLESKTKTPIAQKRQRERERERSIHGFRRRFHGGRAEARLPHGPPRLTLRVLPPPLPHRRRAATLLLRRRQGLHRQGRRRRRRRPP